MHTRPLGLLSGWPIQGRGGAHPVLAVEEVPRVLLLHPTRALQPQKALPLPAAYVLQNQYTNVAIGDAVKVSDEAAADYDVEKEWPQPYSEPESESESEPKPEQGDHCPAGSACFTRSLFLAIAIWTSIKLEGPATDVAGPAHLGALESSRPTFTVAGARPATEMAGLLDLGTLEPSRPEYTEYSRAPARYGVQVAHS